MGTKDRGNKQFRLTIPESINHPLCHIY